MSPQSERPAIRLALVTTELGVGGAERCLVNLALGLAALEPLDQGSPREFAPTEFAPTVYSLAPPPAADRGGLVDRLRAAEIPVHFLGVTRSLQFVQAVLRLRRHLSQQRPQLVQTFLFHANVVGTLAARLSGVPNIVTGVRVADPARWRHRAERLLARSARRIVCVSRDVAQFCQHSAGLPAGKLLVIPNGVDVAGYPQARPADLTELGIPAGERPLVCIGRLHPQKGFDWLLETLPSLLAAAPDQRLLLVGDGPQRDALRGQAERLGLAERVHFAGWRPDVPELLAAGSLLLLPSRYEGMPNVVLEAMAAGRPVLAARVSGVAELLGPLAEPQTFDAGESADFVHKLLSLLDKRQCSEVGEANRRRVAQHFSLDQMVAAYASLYRSLVAPRPSL